MKNSKYSFDNLRLTLFNSLSDIDASIADNEFIIDAINKLNLESASRVHSILEEMFQAAECPLELTQGLINTKILKDADYKKICKAFEALPKNKKDEIRAKVFIEAYSNNEIPNTIRKSNS